MAKPEENPYAALQKLIDSLNKCSKENSEARKQCEAIVKNVKK